MAATIGAMIGVAILAHQIERRVVLRGEDAWRHAYRMADFVYWQTFGDADAAARLYRRAAALEPTGPTAHVLQDRLRRVDALAAPR